MSDLPRNVNRISGPSQPADAKLTKPNFYRIFTEFLQAHFGLFGPVLTRRFSE